MGCYHRQRDVNPVVMWVGLIAVGIVVWPIGVFLALAVVLALVKLICVSVWRLAHAPSVVLVGHDGTHDAQTLGDAERRSQFLGEHGISWDE